MEVSARPTIKTPMLDSWGLEAVGAVKYEVWRLKKACGVVKYEFWTLRKALGVVK